jgi:uncharacterized protein YodC (DUF2158 family)
MINTTKHLAIGHKVKLNSGSPELTVTGIGERITVEWLDGSKTERHTFAAACLTAL